MLEEAVASLTKRLDTLEIRGGAGNPAAVAATPSRSAARAPSAQMQQDLNAEVELARSYVRSCLAFVESGPLEGAGGSGLKELPIWNLITLYRTS